MLYAVNDCLLMFYVKYHDYLWKGSLIKLDTVGLGKKLKNKNESKCSNSMVLEVRKIDSLGQLFLKESIK